ncbi:hypothetical protein A9Q95_03425 [Rhodobacterales bacterium 59_46_T64]|nr:hypothetical protein A9Q95_03425 [Rhodobacterales bacterium 59_46_T64]
MRPAGGETGLFAAKPPKTLQSGTAWPHPRRKSSAGIPPYLRRADTLWPIFSGNFSELHAALPV